MATSSMAPNRRQTNLEFWRFAAEAIGQWRVEDFLLIGNLGWGTEEQASLQGQPALRLDLGRAVGDLAARRTTVVRRAAARVLSRRKRPAVRRPSDDWRRDRYASISPGNRQAERVVCACGVSTRTVRQGRMQASIGAWAMSWHQNSNSSSLPSTGSSAFTSHGGVNYEGEVTAPPDGSAGAWLHRQFHAQAEHGDRAMRRYRFSRPLTPNTQIELSSGLLAGLMRSCRSGVTASWEPSCQRQKSSTVY